MLTQYMISEIAVMLNTGMMIRPCCGQAGIMYDSAAVMIYCKVIPSVGVRYYIRRLQALIQILSSCVELCQVWFRLHTEVYDPGTTCLKKSVTHGLQN
jgi:hypothetical protein